MLKINNIKPNIKEFSSYSNINSPVSLTNDNPKIKKNDLILPPLNNLNLIQNISNLNQNNSKYKFDINILSIEEQFEIAIFILNKQPSSRTTNDINLLMQTTSSVKFFEELIIKNNNNTNIHEQCCKYMTYEKLSKDETLFEIGSYGTKFYIILNGSVKVLANVNNKVIEIGPDGQKIEKNELILTEVKNYYNGDSFGELALLDRKPRAATIITNDETHFMVLEKTHYDKILKKFEEKKFYGEMEFYLSLSIFNSWAYVTMKYLYYHMSKKSFKKGEIVYKENEESNYFYIVRNGEFEMKCKIENEKNLNVTILNKVKQSKYINIGLFPVGTYFGEEEMIDNCMRKSRVTCYSRIGELCQIEKKEFIRRFLEDDKTKEFLLTQKNIKMNWQKEKIKNFTLIQKGYLNINEKTLSPIQQNNISNSSMIGESIQTKNSEIVKDSILMDDSIKQSNILTNKKKQNYFKFTRKTRNSSSMMLELSEIRRELNQTNPIQNLTEINKSDSILVSDYSKFVEENIISRKIKKIDLKPIKINIEEDSQFENLKHGYLEYKNKNNIKAESFSSKDNILNNIKNSIIPSEFTKLKAFKKFEELKENYNYYEDVKGKKKLEDIQKFIIPKKLIIIREELKKKYNEKTNTNRVKSLELQKIKTPKKKTYFNPIINKERKSNNESESNWKKYINYMEKNKSVIYDQNYLLPLKYSAEKIKLNKIDLLKKILINKT